MSEEKKPKGRANQAEKARKQMKEFWANYENAQKRSAALRGVKRSEEAKQKMRDFQARKRMWKYTGRDDI